MRFFCELFEKGRNRIMSAPKFLSDLRASLSAVPGLDRLAEERPAVAVLRLSGIIADAPGRRRGSFSHARVHEAIDKAFKKGKSAVALVLNCPGGSPAQTSLIASQIRALADEKNVPVYCFVEDVAASGGYWLACCADEIYAQDTSIVGSIGVISASFDLHELIARYGVKRRLYTSGADKSFLDPFLPVRDSDVARLKEIQGTIHRDFIAWVKERRAGRLAGEDTELFEGVFWTASAARQLGLIDGTGDYLSFMKRKFGEKTRFIECQPERARFPFSLLGARAGAGGMNLAADAIEAVEMRAAWSRFGL
jgi:signal peptide peptidase SppA